MTGFWCHVDRDALVVSGDDALTFLQGQISQDINPLLDGESAYTFVLQPTGKIEALARVTRRSATEFLVDTDAGWGEQLGVRLNRFKIRVKVDVEPVTARWLAVRGVLERPRGGLPAWGRDDSFDVAGDDPRPPADLREGAPDELEVARILARWPAMGSEVIESSIPAETGVVPFAVSFTKGCYPGQELVERMDSRGSTAPKSVRQLRGTGVVAVGTFVESDGKTVGSITSVAMIGDEWVALALIGRAVQPGDEVVVAGRRSTVD